ncbi:hypothetical protein V6N13_024745 [Hibiscus sabdariffa]
MNCVSVFSRVLYSVGCWSSGLGRFGVGSALAGFEISFGLAVGDLGFQHSSLIPLAAHTPKHHDCFRNVHRRHQKP